jgi:hypothetical protein
MATNRKVSAKELEASGLSLRDFLNKERGLTRKPPEDMKFGVNKPRGPSTNDLATYKAQELAAKGLDENGIAINPKKDDGSGGKNTVDRQNAMIASSRKNAGMPGYSEAGDKMASGGSASSRADGCAQRGKTKGTMIMNRGGMAC